jgi:16S rRNA (adenine1518-N6/adenine1519-N6)-dimethyltransferase
MVEYASLEKEDIVLDIGAGMGFLTRFIAERCKTVVAVEVDTALVSILSEQLASIPNVKIVKGNILKVDVPSFNKIISIPPYHISSRLFSWLFQKRFDCAVLVLQKEFANRLVASVGSENYGWLTVLTYYYANVELFEDVPKWMFHPQPKVNSVIVSLTSKAALKPFAAKAETHLKQLLQSLFTERNKKVRSAAMFYLRKVYDTSKEDAARIAEMLPSSDKRVRELTPQEFGVLINAVNQ